MFDTKESIRAGRVDRCQSDQYRPSEPVRNAGGTRPVKQEDTNSDRDTESHDEEDAISAPLELDTIAMGGPRRGALLDCDGSITRSVEGAGR